MRLVRSRPHRAHPLFAGLIGAALERQRASRLVEVERPEPAEMSASVAPADPALADPAPAGVGAGDAG